MYTTAMVDADSRRQGELRALARLAFDELGDATGGISTMHRAISDRVFGLVGRGVGSAQAPVKAMHDGIAAVVYTGIGSSLTLTGRTAGQALDVKLSAPPSETDWGARIIAVVQGLRGDTLGDDEPFLTGPTTIRHNGAAVAPDPDTLARTFPDARSRIVVFVHGLMESEHAWSLGKRPTYGERLAADIDCTPLFVRYNTGLHISENARLFTELLTDLVASWPVPIDEISFVGHSMGGLVVRSACHIAASATVSEHRSEERARSGANPSPTQTPESTAADELPWVARVRHVVCLGSPHFGAPLEQIVHYASAALTALPETGPLGRLLRRRSNGIRDLRAGSLVDDDWRDLDRDGLRAVTVTDVPLLPDAVHYNISATITRNPRHPVGRLIGDGLVTTPSATGRNRRRRIAFSDEYRHHIGGNHFTLLNNESVYAVLRDWLMVGESPVV